jgi:hypothetical protein
LPAFFCTHHTAPSAALSSPEFIANNQSLQAAYSNWGFSCRKDQEVEALRRVKELIEVEAEAEAVTETETETEAGSETENGETAETKSMATGEWIEIEEPVRAKMARLRLVGMIAVWRCEET